MRVLSSTQLVIIFSKPQCDCTVKHKTALRCNSALFGCLFIKFFGIEDRAVMELRITVVSQRQALIHLEAARCVWKLKSCHGKVGLQ